MTIPLKTIRGVCPHDCPDTCGWIVSVDPNSGQAIEMRGDPDHPFTRGYLCTKVSKYLERVYHPERLKHPLRRSGPKGSGQWTRISWDEALNLIADKFQEIVASSDGPQAILPYSYAGTMGKLNYSSLDRRFFHRLGASLLDRTICASAGGVGCDITLGTRAAIDPQAVFQSRYIINWGSNTKVTNMHLWTIMHQARKAGAKIVTIDPHKSKTAAASDWWIPVRPGTDAALALGIMHLLFKWNLVDHDYLQQYCLGADELRERVTAEYNIDRVARITALPPQTIEQLAREYGNAKQLYGGPAFIRLNYGMQRHGGGAMAVRTVCCLPAITGDWRHVGGGAMLSTSKTYPIEDQVLTRPDLIPPGTRMVNMTQLAEALHGEISGPPIKALYVYNSNPASVCPNQSKVVAGLKRDDLFTVVHDQFMTDTANFADIILPATTQLEHFDFHNSYGHLYLQLNKPAIEPIGESQPNTQVFRLLAKRMQFEDELFQISDIELMSAALQKDAPAFQNFDWSAFEDGLPVRLNLPENWAPFAQGKFPTSTGKCHLYSPTEAAAGRDPLPHYIPPHEDPQTKPELARDYPLQLLSPPAPAFLNSTFANVETLRRAAGEPTLEIHIHDAQPRNILDRDMVRIFNARGTYIARAKITDTVRPGVVVSLGLFWNRDTHSNANVNATTSTALTDQGGGATFFDNLVQVLPLEKSL